MRFRTYGGNIALPAGLRRLEQAVKPRDGEELFALDEPAGLVAEGVGVVVDTDAGVSGLERGHLGADLGKVHLPPRDPRARLHSIKCTGRPSWESSRSPEPSASMRQGLVLTRRPRGVPRSGRADDRATLRRRHSAGSSGTLIAMAPRVAPRGPAGREQTQKRATGEHTAARQHTSVP